MKRKTKGDSGALGMRSALLLGSIIMAILIYRATVPPVYVEHDVAVLAVHNPYRFTFQHVNKSMQLVGRPFTRDICRDYASPGGNKGEDFEPGIVLDEIIHNEEPGCWSLNPDKHCGYYAKYDEHHNPIFLKEAEHGY